MPATQGTKRFGPGIATMRLAAVVSLYRVLRQGLVPEAAPATLPHIWQPQALWQQGIAATCTSESAQ